MATVASPAIYQGGIVIPELKPLKPPKQVVVVFIDEGQEKVGVKNGKKRNTADNVLKALESVKGALPHDIDGVEYENQIRQEAEAHWKRLWEENRWPSI